MTSFCGVCGRPERVTGTDSVGELTYEPHKACNADPLAMLYQMEAD